MSNFKFSTKIYATAYDIALAGNIDGAFKTLADDVQQQLDAPKRKWWHLKRGSTYMEQTRGSLQIVTKPPVEGDIFVLYKGENGYSYIREQSEFEDGRFKEII